MVFVQTVHFQCISRNTTMKPVTQDASETHYTALGASSVDKKL